LAEREELSQLIRAPGAFLDAGEPGIRRIAVGASLAHPDLWPRIALMLRSDPDAGVRRECAEVLGLSGDADPTQIEGALSDASAEVREAAITALGEIASTTSLPVLINHAAADGESKLVREAAVAALGAIGDPAAVAILLELIATGTPQLRRRSVVALSVFDGPEVEAALRQAATDRNPMVREAAEMVVGRTPE